ncbi:MAG: PilN domain-containing protein [Anaerolineales bacterium]|nr:PilN domain-containing protein [Anaerolineales bacterium]
MRTKPDISRSKPRHRGLDLNLLPERHRRRRITTLDALLWLLLLSLLALLIPAFQWYTQASTGYRTLADESARLQEQATQSAPSAAELEALSARLEDTLTRAGELEAALSSIGIRNTFWAEILTVLVSETPEGIELTGVADQGDGVLVEGLSLDETLPLLMAARLEASGVFQDVRVEAIDRITLDEQGEPVVTPTPTRARATPTPTRARATPTPMTPTPTPVPSPAFRFAMTLFLRGGTPAP